MAGVQRDYQEGSLIPTCDLLVTPTLQSASLVRGVASPNDTTLSRTKQVVQRILARAGSRKSAPSHQSFLTSVVCGPSVRRQRIKGPGSSVLVSLLKQEGRLSCGVQLQPQILRFGGRERKPHWTEGLERNFDIASDWRSFERLQSG